VEAATLDERRRHFFDPDNGRQFMSRTAIAATAAMLLIGAHASASEVRRVVTGSDAGNKSTAILDSRITLTPVPNDLGIANLWVTDSYPIGLSNNDTRGKSVGMSPPDNGTQFGVVEFPPFDAGHPAPPLWHRTRTVDYVVVISGEIDLMLEDSTVHLEAGDTVVQQATNHAWVNRGKETCRLLFVLMDAKPQ
jgi:quercetin dioxygenase-like cupin family protein